MEADELLDETEPIECSCGYTIGIGGECLRCGRTREQDEAAERDDWDA